jgi:hypothetical protein
LRIANISSQQHAAAIGMRIDPHKIYRGFTRSLDAATGFHSGFERGAASAEGLIHR